MFQQSKWLENKHNSVQGGLVKFAFIGKAQQRNSALLSVSEIPTEANQNQSFCGTLSLAQYSSVLILKCHT